MNTLRSFFVHHGRTRNIIMQLVLAEQPSEKFEESYNLALEQAQRPVCNHCLDFELEESQAPVRLILLGYRPLHWSIFTNS